MIRSRVAILVTIIFASLAAGEWFARAQLGLGNPPLSVAHPTIEYLFKPNQDVRRFGNSVRINAYGMRSDDFSEGKPESEFRLLVFGDSVLNGGALTDQVDLATELLQEKLETALEQPSVVGNVSAGSWGPGNWLGYAQEYGFFDADMVILLISTHDYRDNPTFAPLNPSTHPQRRPISALGEGITRYLPRYLPSLPTWQERDHSGGLDVSSSDANTDESEIERGLGDLSAFLELAKAQVPLVIVAQFLERSELLRGPGEGYFLIRDEAKKLSVPVVSTEIYFREALQTGPELFRDNIHINELGQTVLAEALLDVLWAQLPEGERTTPIYETQ